MRSVKFKYRGQEYILAATACALFTIYDEYGTGDIFAQTGCMEPSAMGWETACRIAAMLSEQGELQRRALGRDKGEILDADILFRTASPVDALNVREAIREALRLGFSREVVEDEDQEVNLVLREREEEEHLKKKKLRGLFGRGGSPSEQKPSD